MKKNLRLCATAVAWTIVVYVVIMMLFGCSTKKRSMKSLDVEKTAIASERWNAENDWQSKLTSIDTSKYARVIEVIRYDTLHRIKEKIRITEGKQNAVILSAETESKTIISDTTSVVVNESGHEEQVTEKETKEPFNWRAYALAGVIVLALSMWVAGKCNIRTWVLKIFS